MLILFKRKRYPPKQTEPNEIKAYKSLLNESVKSLDIYQIQRELLKIKMMLRLIFTAEQYAAIQICGCQISIDNKQITKQTKEALDISQKQYLDSEHSKLQIKEADNILFNKKQTENNNSQPDAQNDINSNKAIPTSRENVNTIPQVDEIAIQNHLETIELIENDQEILEKYINRYLHNNRIPQSELDQRIIQSIIGFNYIDTDTKL